MTNRRLQRHENVFQSVKVNATEFRAIMERGKERSDLR